MTESELNEAIMEKLMYIRMLLEANGGVQYLSMAIYDDGAIQFHNKSFEKDWKGLRLEVYLRGGE